MTKKIIEGYLAPYICGRAHLLLECKSLLNEKTGEKLIYKCVKHPIGYPRLNSHNFEQERFWRICNEPFSRLKDRVPIYPLTKKLILDIREDSTLIEYSKYFWDKYYPEDKEEFQALIVMKELVS